MWACLCRKCVEWVVLAGLLRVCGVHAMMCGESVQLHTLRKVFSFSILQTRYALSKYSKLCAPVVCMFSCKYLGSEGFIRRNMLYLQEYLPFSSPCTNTFPCPSLFPAPPFPLPFLPPTPPCLSIHTVLYTVKCNSHLLPSPLTGALHSAWDAPGPSRITVPPPPAPPTSTVEAPTPPTQPYIAACDSPCPSELGAWPHL